MCRYVIGELTCEWRARSLVEWWGNGLEFFLYTLTIPLDFLTHSTVNGLQISRSNLLAVELTWSRTLSYFLFLQLLVDQRLSVSGRFLCCGWISRSSHPLATHATARASQAAHRRRRCSLFSLPPEQTTRAFVLLLPLLILEWMSLQGPAVSPVILLTGLVPATKELSSC